MGYPVAKLLSLVSIRNYIALKHKDLCQTELTGLVSIRNYIALKHNARAVETTPLFSIHTKLHRSKTYYLRDSVFVLFSIHTKLHRSKTSRR